ncbi:MAG: T9SS type A sorting domain-containing protein [Bacteroidetes bacterium]|nr:T9SS type A sorting domain-containing protein [Bacteroidota bacterium]
MFIRYLLAGIIFLIPFSGMAGGSAKSSLKKGKSTTSFMHFNYLDAPGYKLFFENNGNIQDQSGNFAVEYPKGSGKSPLFAGGFGLSGYIDDSLATALMASASRAEEWQPGNMVNGLPADPSDPKFRIYKYSIGDVPLFNPDINEWPVDLGAAFNDENNNGVYEPNLGEFPKINGSQQLFYVINDGVPSESRLPGSKPLGLEAQISAFFFTENGPALDNTAFIVYKIINKGGKSIKNAIFSLWADPDLGNSEDDLVGVDSLRSLAYCFNEGATDAIYGSAPPAFGYDFFLGPKVPTGNPLDTVVILGKKYPGFKSLGMNSFVKYVRDRAELHDPSNRNEFRNYQEGLLPDGSEFNVLTEGTGGVATDNPRIVHPGFPESLSGWRDTNSADRRMMINTQPFNFEPGDTQVIIVGYVIGQGQSNLESIADLRTKSDESQFAYDDLVSIVPGKLKLGKLSMKITDKAGAPESNAKLYADQGGVVLADFQNINTVNGNFSTLLYEGNYSIRIIGFEEVWGLIPDTVDNDVTIFTDQETSLEVKLTRKQGYSDSFDGLFSSEWIPGAPGDTTYTPTQKSWSVANGYLGWPANVAKGTYSVTSTVDLTGYPDPELSFQTNHRLGGTGDVLQILASGDNGNTWVTLDTYEKEWPNVWQNKAYFLKSYISISGLVKIRFVLKKITTSPVLAKIDNFSIKLNGLTSVGNGADLISNFTLLPAYPNPFNPSTTIRWIQPFGGEATIRVMNLLGQEVSVISAGNRVSGQNEQTLSFSGLASGLYFYRIDLNGKSSPTGKLMLLK